MSCNQTDENSISPLKILFLGESTTIGVGSSNANQNYVSKTISFFRDSGYPIEYKVMAKSGMSSSWGTTRLSDINEYLPDIIIIEFLINDQTLPISTIKKNYEIFSKIPYGKIILFEIYDKRLFMQYRSNPELNPFTKAHSNMRWALQIDTLSTLPSNWGDYLVDGTHPSDEGYSILANLLIQRMQSILTEVLLGKVFLDRSL